MNESLDTDIDIALAILDPAQVFDSPQQLIDSAALTENEKIRILRQWEYDAREREVAEEENMCGTDHHWLPDILAALASFGDKAPHHDSPTKQGGE